MNIVIDSNVLFSALIKNSTTRKLILEYEGSFLFPEFIFEEIEKHKAELLKKSKMDQEDFDTLLKIILQKVTVIPNEEMEPHKQDAVEIMSGLDMNDVIFVACALTYHGSIIWSDDKGLKRQARVRIVTTEDVLKKPSIYHNEKV